MSKSISTTPARPTWDSSGHYSNTPKGAERDHGNGEVRGPSRIKLMLRSPTHPTDRERQKPKAQT